MIMVLLAALAVGSAEPPDDDAKADVAGLQQMYDQSCAAREYGAFDDLCDQLSHQLHQARAAAAREARRRPHKTAATVAPPPPQAPSPPSVDPKAAPAAPEPPSARGADPA